MDHEVGLVEQPAGKKESTGSKESRPQLVPPGKTRPRSQGHCKRKNDRFESDPHNAFGKPKTWAWGVCATAEQDRTEFTSQAKLAAESFARCQASTERTIADTKPRSEATAITIADLRRHDRSKSGVLKESSLALSSKELIRSLPSAHQPDRGPPRGRVLVRSGRKRRSPCRSGAADQDPRSCQPGEDRTLQ